MGLLKDIFKPYKISAKEQSKLSKFIIWKNVLLLCVSMGFFLTATSVMSSIQSTINKAENLGLISSSILFTVGGLTSIMIPQLLIYYIQLKWTLTLGYVLQIFYIGLTAYPRWYTYIPAYTLSGFGQVLSFISAGTLIDKLSQIYDEVLQNAPNYSKSLFFGIFGFFLQLANIIGNVFIALVFKRDSELNSTLSNYTFNYGVCGKNFCPNSQLPHSADPEMKQVYILIGIIGLCSIVSIILSVFINIFECSQQANNARELVLHQLQELKSQCLQIKQLLAAPMAFITGFILTFMWMDFTRSFAACSSGLESIGWTALVLYGTAAFFSPIFGRIASRFTVIPVFLFYWSLIIGTCILMLVWEPSQNTLYIIYILAVLIGLIESINSSIPRALYGIIFNTEVIYSVYSSIQGFSELVAVLITTYTCTYIKIYILIGICIICFFCGIGLYILERQQKVYDVECSKSIPKLDHTVIKSYNYKSYLST